MDLREMSGMGAELKRASLQSMLIAICLGSSIGAHSQKQNLGAAGTAAQAADAKEWPTYGHDSGGMRFSPLTQINPTNVGNLTVAWVYHMKQEGDTSGRRSRPGGQGGRGPGAEAALTGDWQLPPEGARPRKRRSGCGASSAGGYLPRRVNRFLVCGSYATRRSRHRCISPLPTVASPHSIQPQAKRFGRTSYRAASRRRVGLNIFRATSKRRRRLLSAHRTPSSSRSMPRPGRSTLPLA